MASGSSRPVASTPSAQPGDDHPPVDASRPPSLISRRVEFVPQSMAASMDIAGDAIGGVDGRQRTSSEVVVDPAADGVVAAGEVPGVVGVEALHADAGAADAAAGAVAGVVGGDAPRRARRRSARGRRPARSGSTSASARSTPPAASRRETRCARARPTSQ